MSRVLSLHQLAQLRPSLEGVVLVGGAFDILHTGHTNHIAEAKAQGKNVVVHVTSDKRVREKKGIDHPFFTQDERAAIIASLANVDYVFIDDLPHYHKQIVETLQPDILFLNQEAATKEVRKYLATNHQSVKIIISSTPKYNSSSKIIRRLKGLLD